MSKKSSGAFFEWYCDWCDSKNLSQITRFEKGEVVCGACHRSQELPDGTFDAQYKTSTGTQKAGMNSYKRHLNH
jgi:hypothetical protein